MNIDERIEALAQSLELLGHIQRDNDARFEERFAKVTGDIEKLTGAVDKLVNVVERLTAVALSHEERIERLEKE